MLARGRWWMPGLAMAAALGLGLVAAPRAIAEDGDGAGDTRDKVAWLGVMLDEVDGGAHVVAVIDDSPADEAGIPRGAVITAVDGEAIDGPDELRRAIRRHAPGDKVTLSLREESGAERTVEVTLGETDRRDVRVERFVWKGLPDGFEKHLEGHDGEWTIRPMPRTWLGVELLSPSAGVRRALGGPADAGVLVNEVAEDSPAAKAGLEAGDLIVAIDGAPVDSVRALRRILGKHEPGDTVTVEIVRRGDRRSVQVTLGESKSRVFMFRQHGEGPVIAIPPDLEIELPDLDELREHLRSLDDEQIEIDIDEIESRVREALERAREALERSREAQERHREHLERRPGAGGGRVIDAMVGPGSGFAHPTTVAI